jgi:transposase
MGLEVIHPVCAGIDVHKRDLKVCLVWRDPSGQRQEETRTYSTMVDDLERARDWLQTQSCRVVAIESTGVYWQPVFSVLEAAGLQVWLVNPTHIKQVQARKTDVKDAAWLAQLLEHGLLKRSFIPPQPIRDLRLVTRYRRKLIEAHTAEVNRVQKLLEQASLKLGNVVSDVQGVSAQAILRALLAGERDPQRLAALARGTLRRKQAELVRALQALPGHWQPHHTALLAQLLAHLDYLDESIAQCDAQAEELCRPYVAQVQRLDTITGVGRRSAQDLLAELGVDMSVWPTHKHLSSWAHLCPGTNESAGKRKSARTGKGNKWVKAILVECAHAAGRTKQTYLGAQYRREVKGKGKKHAAIVVGHSILVAAYHMLRDEVDYRDLGVDHFDNLKKDRLIRYYARRLGELGIHVPRELLAVPTEATAVSEATEGTEGTSGIKGTEETEGTEASDAIAGIALADLVEAALPTATVKPKKAKAKAEQPAKAPKTKGAKTAKAAPAPP